MNPLRTSFLFLLAALSLGAAPDPGKFAPQAAECQRNAEWVQNWVASLLDTAKQPPSLGSVDAALIAGEVQKEIDAWAAAADAWKKGEEKRAGELMEQARKISERRGVWDKRLGWRWQQGQNAASENDYEGLCTWRARREMALAIEARRKVSEACGRVAEATLPGADPQLLAKLQEEVFAAQVDLEVAEMRVGWAGEDAYAMREPVVWSPEFKAAQQRVTDNRAQQEARHRQIRAAQHEFENNDRLRGPLLEQRNKVAEAARSSVKK